MSAACATRGRPPCRFHSECALQPNGRHSERSEESPREAHPPKADSNLAYLEIRYKKNAYVYIMANASRTIYVGVTSSLERRVWEHKTHFQDGFAKQRHAAKLMYMAEFERMDDVIAREKAVKGKARAMKLALIEAGNPRWNDLAWNWFDDGPQAPAPPSSASRGIQRGRLFAALRVTTR